MKKVACARFFLLILLPIFAAAYPLEKRANPTNLFVNTAADEDEPHLSPDGLRLFYSSAKKGISTQLVSKRKKVGDNWPAGKEANDLEEITQDQELAGLFMPPVKKDEPSYLFYAAKDRKADKPNYDIFVAMQTLPGPDKVFTAPTALLTVDTTDDEAHPWLTGDGKNLYFSRKTKDKWQQFVVRREDGKGKGGFKEPESLGFDVGFHHATVTPDNKIMVLQGPLSKNRWGLFISTFKNKEWSKPEPLDILNHPDAPTGDRSPSFSRDGTKLYFASDRPGGKGGLDLWVIPSSDVLK